MKRSGLRCSCCGGLHLLEDCPWDEDHPRVPLETPSGNGPYKGTIPVRVLPQGESGSGEFSPVRWGSHANKGHIAQSRTATLKRLQPKAQAPRKPRAPRKPVSHCLRGHEFTPENAIVCKDGHRRCRTCRNDRQAEWRAGKKL